MRKSLLINLLLITTCGLWFSQVQAAPGDQGSAQGQAQAVDRDKLGYFYGYNFGNMLRQQSMVNLNLEELRRGMEDSLAGKTSRLSPEEHQQQVATIQALQTAVQEQRMQSSQSNAMEFLQSNAGRKEIKITKSGLQYEVKTEGTGEHPVATDRVSVHYKGQLIDGKEFDSSYSRGEPAEFGLGQVIPGWTEGLQLMTPGSKYRFYIPPELGYGAGGVPRAGIPPNAVLIFDVELLAIK